MPEPYRGGVRWSGQLHGFALSLEGVGSSLGTKQKLTEEGSHQILLLTL